MSKSKKRSWNCNLKAKKKNKSKTGSDCAFTLSSSHPWVALSRPTRPSVFCHRLHPWQTSDSPGTHTPLYSPCRQPRPGATHSTPPWSYMYFDMVPVFKSVLLHVPCPETSRLRSLCCCGRWWFSSAYPGWATLLWICLRSRVQSCLCRCLIVSLLEKKVHRITHVDYIHLLTLELFIIFFARSKSQVAILYALYDIRRCVFVNCE